jgi:hypothetical protein
MSAVTVWKEHLARCFNELSILNRELSLKGSEVSKDEAVQLADQAHTVRLRAGDVFEQLNALVSSKR